MAREPAVYTRSLSQARMEPNEAPLFKTPATETSAPGPAGSGDESDQGGGNSAPSIHGPASAATTTSNLPDRHKIIPRMLQAPASHRSARKCGHGALTRILGRCDNFRRNNAVTFNRRPATSTAMRRWVVVALLPPSAGPEWATRPARSRPNRHSRNRSRVAPIPEELVHARVGMHIPPSHNKGQIAH